MLYTIVEQIDEKHQHFILINFETRIETFKSKKEAEIERIYLQPEYDNLLKVIKFK